MTKHIPSDKDVSNVSDLSNSINKIVVSRGNPFAKLMIIGEAPGAKEEEMGEPFVGRSGKLLDKLLQNAGIDINQMFIFATWSNVDRPKIDAQQRLKFKKIFLGCINK